MSGEKADIPDRPVGASGGTSRIPQATQTVWANIRLLDGRIRRGCVAYLVALTLASISYEADRSAALHNDRNSLARGTGRSANAVPGIPATAQRGHRGLERGDERTAIGALRALYHASLAAEATLKYANNNRESCDISVPLLNRMEGYHREAVQARDNVCAGRPLRPYPADIIQR